MKLKLNSEIKTINLKHLFLCFILLVMATSIPKANGSCAELYEKTFYESYLQTRPDLSKRKKRFLRLTNPIYKFAKNVSFYGLAKKLDEKLYDKYKFYSDHSELNLLMAVSAQTMAVLADLAITVPPKILLFPTYMLNMHDEVKSINDAHELKDTVRSTVKNLAEKDELLDEIINLPNLVYPEFKDKKFVSNFINFLNYNEILCSPELPLLGEYPRKIKQLLTDPNMAKILSIGYLRRFAPPDMIIANDTQEEEPSMPCFEEFQDDPEDDIQQFSSQVASVVSKYLPTTDEILQEDLASENQQLPDDIFSFVSQYLSEKDKDALSLVSKGINKSTMNKEVYNSEHKDKPIDDKDQTIIKKLINESLGADYFMPSRFNKMRMHYEFMSNDHEYKRFFNDYFKTLE